jgi:FkbM family methyltransferase
MTITLDFATASSTSVGAALMRGEQFEPEILDLVCFLCRKAEKTLFIDVGSNIGYFPLAMRAFAKAFGRNIDIHAHEPLPALCSVARSLQHANSLKYKLHSSALSNQRGQSDFYVSAVSDSSNSLQKGFRKHKATIKVTVNTLDSAYLAYAQLHSFTETIIMIDVESAEHLVLEGGLRTLQLLRPHIVCEVLAGRNESDIARILSTLDYVYYRFDGLVWRREQHIFGDPSYRYRDWWFIPSERTELLTGDTLTIPSHLSISARQFESSQHV